MSKLTQEEQFARVIATWDDEARALRHKTHGRIRFAIARLLTVAARLCRLEVSHDAHARPHPRWFMCQNCEPPYRLTDRVCAECGESLINYSPLSRDFQDYGPMLICQVCAMFTVRGPAFVPSIHDRNYDAYDQRTMRAMERAVTP